MADHNKIDELLAQVTDPVMRSLVIVLGSINRDLEAQTRATEGVARGMETANMGIAKVDVAITTHVQTEEVLRAEYKTQLKIASYIGPILFTVLTSVGSYLWVQQEKKLDAVTDEARVTRQRQMVNEEILLDLRRRQALDEQMRR